MTTSGTGAERNPSVNFRARMFGDYESGALDISLQTRRIISIPSQLGCRVGCSFCISNTVPIVRNLTADEMLALVRDCLNAEPPDGRPIELSFTGEGEALLNWRQAKLVCEALPSISPDFTDVRYCFSGLAAERLLPNLHAGPYPMRLQFSLHAARQELRDVLVPVSSPLGDILRALRTNAHRFSAVELNVALSDGVNDSPADLQALANWGDPAWPIVLNPLLQNGHEHVAGATNLFEEKLKASGRMVKRYQKIGASISRQKLYKHLTAARIIFRS